MMSGLFASSHGHPYVTRERLRASLNRVRLIRKDPPRMDPIKRRKYAVKGPLAMWHIDGHHKLIRWVYFNFVMLSGVALNYFFFQNIVAKTDGA